MKNLLIKECRLGAHPLSWFFIVFALMTLIPGYPILVGAFFICFGIFQSYQQGRENNDILFTVLLPICKKDAVTAKYLFACLIEMIAFVVMALLTAFRMTILSGVDVYTQNPMMNANPLFLAWVLIVFSLFNGIFIRGFFRTGWKVGKPFIRFAISAFVVITIAETLHHLPGLTFLNATDGNTFPHWISLAVGILVCAVTNALSCRAAQQTFEKVDL